MVTSTLMPDSFLVDPGHPPLKQSITPHSFSFFPVQIVPNKVRSVSDCLQFSFRTPPFYSEQFHKVNPEENLIDSICLFIACVEMQVSDCPKNPARPTIIQTLISLRGFGRSLLYAVSAMCLSTGPLPMCCYNRV